MPFSPLPKHDTMSKGKTGAIENPQPASGEVIRLGDGRNYRLNWSGLISETKVTVLGRVRKGTLSGDLVCRKCGQQFVAGVPYYNRKGPRSRAKSRYYCLPCAELLGYIELV